MAQRTWYIGLKNNTAATLCPLIAVIQLLYHHPLYRAAVEATDPLTWEFQGNEGAQAAVAELRSLFHTCVFHVCTGVNGSCLQLLQLCSAPYANPALATATFVGSAQTGIDVSFYTL